MFQRVAALFPAHRILGLRGRPAPGARGRRVSLRGSGADVVRRCFRSSSISSPAPPCAPSCADDRARTVPDHDRRPRLPRRPGCAAPVAAQPRLQARGGAGGGDAVGRVPRVERHIAGGSALPPPTAPAPPPPPLPLRPFPPSQTRPCPPGRVDALLQIICHSVRDAGLELGVLQTGNMLCPCLWGVLGALGGAGLVILVAAGNVMMAVRCAGVTMSPPKRRVFHVLRLFATA